MNRFRTAVLSAFVVLSLGPDWIPRAAPPEGPEPLDYQELVTLYRQEFPTEPLRKKLERLLSTPWVNNDAAARGVAPRKPRSEQLGPLLRAVCWNIERGIEFESLKNLFGDVDRFAAQLDSGAYPPGSAEREAVLRDARELQHADLIVLNEVDWGMKRTGYRNVVEELAAALSMNYAYGVEFVEVDPIALGIEKFEGASAEDRAELTRNIQVDPARYKGMHGNAILSRYPLQNVRLVPLDNQGYDWYREEQRQVARLEAGKREVAQRVFLEKVLREVRRGGRMMLQAEISDPDLPTGKVVVVATHLEARTKPRNRARQLGELLYLIKGIRHPVILAGDMNTTTKDSTPTSIKREIKKRLGSEKFWLQQGIKYATGIGILLDFVVGGLSFGRTQGDPTVRHVPIVAPNPEARFFELLEEFTFEDGGVFDFRGEIGRTLGEFKGTLANSNQRDDKGFASTFEVERTIGPAGKFKLDWIFVKPPDLRSPRDEQGPRRFAPHFGRTLQGLNYSLADRISDHNPILADLPLCEPGSR